MSENLFLAAYDVRDPCRLRRALNVLKDYASGGQKSVFECYLTKGERQEMLERIAGVIDIHEDSFVIIPLPERLPFALLGSAVPPQNSQFMYVG